MLRQASSFRRWDLGGQPRHRHQAHGRSARRCRHRLVRAILHWDQGLVLAAAVLGFFSGDKQ